ncbi:EAL domain-containing protein [Sanguibacter sp. 25GB23B1]
MEWVRDRAAGTTGGLLGDLSVAAVVVDATIRANELDELFRREEDLRCVVLRGPDGPVLVARSWFEMTMTGRLGYGRLLHARTPILEMILEPSLVMGHDSTVAAAASAVIARRSPGTAADAVVVEWEDGSLGVAFVSTVFERLARQYAHQSWHDPLTMLPNRRYLIEQIQSLELQRADAGTSWQAVLFYVDLDRFKDVNDQLGHGAGDQVLTQFASRLLSVSRVGDVVVRLGGDEFAILATSPLTVAQAGALASRLVLEAAAPFVVELADAAGAVTERTVTIGASVGVAHSDLSLPSVLVTSLEVLLKQADIAMYRAKEQGRGRSTLYDPQIRTGQETSEATTARRRMERSLRAAIDQGSLTVHYQPVVDLPSGRVIGVEALARWHDPVLGNVPPDQFIPVAEQTGLINDLGEWVLRTACRQGAVSTVGVDDELTVAVNVSPVQLAQPGFVAVVLSALEDSGLAARRLCLEITETAAVADLEATAEQLRELRGHGVQIALDDFGTGHSSLTMLRALPLTTVKIDRSFVENVARSAQDAVLVRMVIETAHVLGLRVCAEGIEDADQAAQLVALGCDTAQGWYFGMPEPPSERLTRALRWTVGPDMFDASAPAPVPLGAADELILVTTPEHVITYASSTAQGLVGWTPQQLVGTPVLDHLHPESVARLASLDPTTVHDGRATHRVRHRDGGERWFDTRSKALRDEDGTVREVISVGRDVSAVRRTQGELADSEQKFRHVFDDAPTGMVLSGSDGRMLRVNPAFTAMVGRVPADLVGRLEAEIIDPGDHAEEAARLGALRDGTVSSFRLVRRYLGHDGVVVPAEVRASVIRDDAGGVVYVMGQVSPR